MSLCRLHCGEGYGAELVLQLRAQEVLTHPGCVTLELSYIPAPRALAKPAWEQPPSLHLCSKALVQQDNNVWHGWAGQGEVCAS